MANVINMQDMRHLNLFEKITKINTKFCFRYNNTIIFSVPRHLVYKAIGENGKNAKKIYTILEKRIRIISSPAGIQDAKNFVEDIVNPIPLKEFEIKDNEIILSASSQNKAALIGRNKRRFFELQKIVKNFFGKELRIV